MICFMVNVEPRGKGRPRFTAQGHPYTPKETVTYERTVRNAYLNAVGKCSAFAQGVPIKVKISFRFRPPESWSNKRIDKALWGELVPAKKPDIDNLVKAVLDALNHVAYHDDSQIVSLNVNKEYAAVPGVTVWIEEWKAWDDGKSQSESN